MLGDSTGCMKRKARNDLLFVQSGFRACWRNSSDLVSAATTLLDAKHHGVGLSVSVLAMEEIGKMMFIDGLLFAKPGDQKDEAFRSGYRNHQWKLRALDLFPMFIRSLAMSDPRYDTEDHFRIAMTISLKNLNQERARVAEEIGLDCNLTELDNWKQQGFYAGLHENKNTVLTPNEVIREDFARAVHTLAKRFTTSVDFLLKNGGIDRYFAQATSIRSALSELDHQMLEGMGKQYFERIFGVDADSHTTN